MEKQMSSSDFANRDVIGFYREGPAAEFHTDTVMATWCDAKRFSTDNNEQPTAELISDLRVATTNKQKIVRMKFYFLIPSNGRMH